MSDSVTVAAPATSTFARPWPRPPGIRANVSANTAAPIGRLTRKTQCQLSVSVRTPPSSTPMLPPAAITNPKKPIAFVRSIGSVKSIMISESATADTTAPPRPCTARAATSIPCDVESAQRSDAAVKRPIPLTKRRRWPKRSPSRPPSSRKPPNVSRYAFTTHASEVSEKPRSLLIDGSATFTIVVSRTIIRLPRQRTPSASQRVRESSAVIGPPSPARTSRRSCRCRRSSCRRAGGSSSARRRRA